MRRRYVPFNGRYLKTTIVFLYGSEKLRKIRVYEMREVKRDAQRMIRENIFESGRFE